MSRASLDDALSGRGEPRLPTVWWGFIAAAVGALWWLIFHRYHRWTTWFIGVIPFVIVLFVFYYHLERLLPANYYAGVNLRRPGKSGALLAERGEALLEIGAGERGFFERADLGDRGIVERTWHRRRD